MFLLLASLLISPIPASITTQAPHAMRSFTMLPVLQFIVAAGSLEFWHVTRNTIGLGRWGIAVFVLVWSIWVFRDGYFVRFPFEQSDSFQFALSKAIPEAISQSSGYDRIIFSNRGSLYQSYMFYLFYSAYDPLRYQRDGGTLSGGFDKKHIIENVEFRAIDWSKERIYPRVLYIVDSDEVPQHIHVRHIFKNLDGKKTIQSFTL